MARTKDITFFEMKLLEFADSKDPLLEMLDWMTKQLMEFEISISYFLYICCDIMMELHLQFF